MAYEYTDDPTRAGDLWMWSENYQLVQEGLQLLRDRLDSWDKRVAEAGGTPPLRP